MHIDIDILVYAIIAAVLLGRLWAVLGTRNDNEPQRQNPFVPPPAPPPETDTYPGQPQNIPSRLAPAELPPTSLAGGLAQVASIDKNFNEKQFLLDARDSFTTIVEAYASGDITRLSGILSTPLMVQFQGAADARKAAGQTAQTRVMKIKDAEPIAAQTVATQALITVKFVSDQENILRDQSGTILGGAEGKPEEVTDIWVFAKETASESKWVVVETRS